MLTETTADAAPAASAPARGEREKRIPGEAGVWVFIFGDLVMFTAFIGVYFVNRGLHKQLFAASQVKLDQSLGALNTVLLLASSLFVVLAVRAVRARRTDLAPRLIATGILCGLGFLAVKGFEYHDKIDHHLVPGTNDFFLYYYLLTGLHAVHVTIGLIVLTVLFFFSRKEEVTEGQYIFIEAGACFWHMVDLLWIFIFPLVFLVH